MILKRAILWSNGMVMAFDEHGKQAPEYQGVGTEIIPKIREDFPALVIEGMDWATDRQKDRDLDRKMFVKAGCAGCDDAICDECDRLASRTAN
jgi:hypothetical protein